MSSFVSSSDVEAERGKGLDFGCAGLGIDAIGFKISWVAAICLRVDSLPQGEPLIVFLRGRGDIPRLLCCCSLTIERRGEAGGRFRTLPLGVLEVEEEAENAVGDPLDGFKNDTLLSESLTAACPREVENVECGERVEMGTGEMTVGIIDFGVSSTTDDFLTS